MPFDSNPRRYKERYLGKDAWGKPTAPCCEECGAFVWDTDVHDDFHRRLDLLGVPARAELLPGPQS